MFADECQSRMKTFYSCWRWWLYSPVNVPVIAVEWCALSGCVVWNVNSGRKAGRPTARNGSLMTAQFETSEARPSSEVHETLA